MYGKVLKDLTEAKKKEQDNCNHQKGGVCELNDDKEFTGKVSNTDGHFNSQDYAVLKHKHHWGDIWVRCLRCGKTWKPGDADYEKALAFPTRNTMSTSGSDWVIIDRKPIQDKARELTKGS